ncbi:MAG: hypothetical protein K2H04_08790, partial [Bacteroidaceae bacterium]|nr:hypothetical protein [Bacteroidaceae bacterium]
VVYNASAFQLAEGSMLDALVKQLPGVELDSDGRIYHNGKFVESLLLNGKEFFKGDNRVMLDNLPSYTVKQIEFYDKYGEKSEFLGQQLEADKGYVMDVKLKKEYSIGYLANVEAGGGPSFGEVHGDDAPKADERYLARLFATRFTDHSRVAIFANANNLNDETRPGEDNNWNQRQSGKTGRATQQQGGIDYNVDARNKKWNVQGNTRFAHAKRDLQTTTHRTNFLPSGDTYERSRSMADDRSFSLNTWNQFRYNFPKVQLTLTPFLQRQVPPDARRLRPAQPTQQHHPDYQCAGTHRDMDKQPAPLCAPPCSVAHESSTKEEKLVRREFGAKWGCKQPQKGSESDPI